MRDAMRCDGDKGESGERGASCCLLGAIKFLRDKKRYEVGSAAHSPAGIALLLLIVRVTLDVLRCVLLCCVVCCSDVESGSQHAIRSCININITSPCYVGAAAGAWYIEV